MFIKITMKSAFWADFFIVYDIIIKGEAIYMKTYEEIRNCFNAIKNNIITCNELDQDMFSFREYPDWLAVYKKRSIGIREIYKKNTDMVNTINKYLSLELNDEEALAMYEGYRALEERDLHDSYLLISVIDKLIPIYEGKKDIEKLLHLYTDRCYELGCFLRLGNSSLERLRNDLHKIKDLRVYYKNLSSIKERRLIYVAYYNILRTLPSYSARFNEDIIPMFKEAKAFYSSSVVRDMMDQEFAHHEGNLLNIMLLHSFMFYLDDGLSQQMEFTDLIDEIKDTFEDEMDTDLCNAVLSYFHDQMNDEEFVYYLRNYLKFYFHEANELTFNETQDEIFVVAENLFNTAFMFYDFLKYSYLCDAEKKKEAYAVTEAIASFLKRIPQEKYNIFFDEAASTLIRKAIPFIESVADKERLLGDILVKKQPMNYLHSKMVESLSLSILDYLNKANDSLLDEFYKIGFKDYIELREYVARGAKLHDLGKSISTGLITQQIRSLTEVEYKYVKMHPEKALEIIDKDKGFMPYFDIMIGHHKDYDGKKGYPLSFDNTKSKYKIVIDLVRIADAIDAGTDVYGRNYSLGKNFDMVFAELVKGEGTKYNPEIVEFIRKHSDLMNELRYKTIDGRYELIYNCYFR